MFQGDAWDRLVSWWDGCGDNFQIQWLLVNDRDVLQG